MLFVALGIDKIIENMKSNQSPFSKKSVRLTFQEFFPDLTSTSDYESEHSDEEYNFDDVSDNSDVSCFLIKIFSFKRYVF